MSDEDKGKDDKPKLSVVTEETQKGKPGRKKMTPQQKARDLYRLDDVDAKICEILYENPVATVAEIAALLGVTQFMIRQKIKKPAVRTKLDKMRQTVHQLIERGQVLGIRRLMQLMGSKDEWIALQACKAVLAPVLNVAKITTEQRGEMIYEVRIGEQGQIYRSEMPTGHKMLNQGMTTIDLITDPAGPKDIN